MRSRETYHERPGDFRRGFNDERHGGNRQTRPDITDSLVTDEINEDLSDIWRLDCW